MRRTRPAAAAAATREASCLFSISSSPHCDKTLTCCLHILMSELPPVKVTLTHRPMTGVISLAIIRHRLRRPSSCCNRHPADAAICQPPQPLFPGLVRLIRPQQRVPLNPMETINLTSSIFFAIQSNSVRMSRACYRHTGCSHEPIGCTLPARDRVQLFTSGIQPS